MFFLLLLLSFKKKKKISCVYCLFCAQCFAKLLLKVLYKTKFIIIF